MRASLQQPDGDNLARLFLAFANANGGLPSDYQAKVQACIQEQHLLIPQAVGDDRIPLLCSVIAAASTIDTAGAWLGVGCDTMLIAGVGALLIPSVNVGTPAALLGWAVSCGAVETQLELVKLLTSFFKDIEPDLLLEASPLSPSSYQPAIIKARLEMVGIDDVCRFGTTEGIKKLSQQFIKQAINIVAARKAALAIALIDFVSEGAAERIQKVLAKGLELVVNASGIMDVFSSLAEKICGIFGGVELPIDLNGILTPRNPPGTLKFFPDDGHAEYTCPIDSNEASGDVTFKATKKICDKEKLSQVNVICPSNLKMSPETVNLSGEGGKDYRIDAVVVRNDGTQQANFSLNLKGDITNATMILLPFIGTLESKESKPIDAQFSCPTNGGQWNGQIELHRRSDDKIEDTSEISLTCTCVKKDCCGRCCQPGETPGQKCADAGGDPHLTTFDGLAYDFQAVGEFVLAKSLLPNDTFEVQIRTRPWFIVSVIQAVAMNVAGDRVGIYSDMNPSMRVNGVPTELAEGGEITLPLGGKIVRQVNEYTVSWPDESRVRITDGGYLNVKVSVPDAKKGQVIGLLGNADDNRQNDITIRDGASLGTQIEFTTLYPSYADSWRIGQQGSLFDYAPGETTETFTDRDFPRVRATAADFPTDVRSSAEKICREAGITDPVLLENCILDVALTGDVRFAQIPSDLAKPQEVASISEPPSMSYQTVQFRSTVYDDTTGQPLNAGQVSLTVDGNPLPHVTIRSISSDGTFETDLVPRGPAYQLEIKVDGYVTEKIFGLYDSAPDRVYLVPSGVNRADPIIVHATEYSPNGDGDGEALSNVNVFAQRHINQRQGDPVISAVTDQNGYAILWGSTSGSYTLEIQREGYITQYIDQATAYITTRTQTVTLKPVSELRGVRFRTVLTWDESPSDLDLHLTIPNFGKRSHVYYGFREGLAPWDNLDRDDASSFGPEAIIMSNPPGDYHSMSDSNYRYSVHDYSNRDSTSSQAPALSGARVEVYEYGQLVATYSVPNQEGTLWTVFEIDPAGRLIPINHMSYPSRPTSTVTDYWHILSQRDKN